MEGKEGTKEKTRSVDKSLAGANSCKENDMNCGENMDFKKDGEPGRFELRNRDCGSRDGNRNNPRKDIVYQCIGCLEILERDFLSESLTPKTIELDREEISVGRNISNDYILRIDEVSRRQAVMEIYDDEVYIRDLGSCNGTYVNGRKISQDVKVRCMNEDIISFSDISYRLKVNTIENFGK